MLLKNWMLAGLAVFVVSACAQKRPELQGKTESEKLQSFFAWSFDQFINESPMEMTYLGIDKKQDQLDSFSEKAEKKRLEMAKEHLRILETFDREPLKPQDQLSYDLFKIQMQERIDGYQWRDYTYAVNQMFGIQAELPSFMINMHQVKDKEDLDNYLSRLNEFKRALAQVTNGLMRSETHGVVPPRFVFSKVIDDCKNIISGKPFVDSKNESPLYKDFLRKMQSLKLSADEKKQYHKKLDEALLTSVGPGFADLIAFLEKQEKRATTDDGAWKFPRGDEYYKYRLQKMTTTDLSADKIHEIGLKNVQRIHNEMKQIAKKVKFKGDLKAYFKFMNSKRFLYPNTKKGRSSYLQKAKKIIADMRKQLDKVFLTKPKAAIVVKAVEPFREKSAGMAFYQSPAPDGSRPGTYYVNLYKMQTLPKWEAEALAYHEGIPGHHMQISIAQELKGVPKFRRYSHFTAYVEGWGLYAESLAKEMGFYKDPYSDFGRLSMELTRACRLVVDTGLHHKKWTREKAIEYLDNHLPGDHFDNERQIQRYIVMPGQATAYMIGMLKIKELREKAKKAMGDQFDIRKFHDVILTNGPVPLTILESLVDDYIKNS